MRFDASIDRLARNAFPQIRQLIARFSRVTLLATLVLCAVLSGEAHATVAMLQPARVAAANEPLQTRCSTPPTTPSPSPSPSRRPFA